MGEERESRKAAGFDGAPLERIIQVEERRVMGRQERGSNCVQARLCHESNVHRAGLSATTGGRYRFVPIEYSEPRAIQKDF